MEQEIFIHAGLISEGTLLCHDSFGPMYDALKQLDYERWINYSCDWASTLDAFLNRGNLDGEFGDAWEALSGELNLAAAERDYYFGGHPDDGAALGFWPIEWIEG